jgi:hypothetical protein
MMLLTNAPDVASGDADSRPDDGVYTDWVDYTRALHEAGVLLAGEGLQTPDTATSVRVRDGERLLTDGPFADTKEHLIGFYLVDLPDLDAALDWAARVPNVRTGTVEVRPVIPGTSPQEMLASG